MDLDAETLAPTAAAMRPDASPVRFDADPLDEIVREALRRGATKVHLEPEGEGLVVRYRLAGGLSEAARLLPDTAAEARRRARQVPLTVAGRSVAAACHAVAGGERIVLHLGAAPHVPNALEALGMRAELAQALFAALARRGGLAIAAGPPGSGRRRTLAAIAGALDDGSRCVLPLPDANAAIGERFAAVMRQDADVIVAGTIDDRQTAAAAFRAAEAGHLVLATIDSGDAIGAILRLRELRVEPFRLASALHAVLAQRVAHRLCGQCREPVQAEGSVSALLGFDAGAVVYAAAGCEACDGGIAGRRGVFEAILPDAALRRLINDGGDGAIIARHAFLNAPNLGSAARALVREGVISAEEAVRLSRG